MKKSIFSRTVIFILIMAMSVTCFCACGDKTDYKELYRREGISKLDNRDYEGAIESFLLALEQSHGFVKDVDYDINYYLGYAYYKTGEYEKAVETYDAILDLKPKDVDGYYYRGLCKLKLGDREGADADFLKVTKAKPKNYDAYLDVYLCFMEAGYEEDARTYLEEAMKNSSSMSDYDKGRFYYYLGNYSDARIYLEKAKSLTDPDTILMLGKTYEAVEDYNYAAILYNEYLQGRGNNAAVYNQLGVCRMKMGDYENALSAFSSGLNLRDREWEQELLYNEAITYEYMLDFETAYIKMGEYVEKYPKDKEAAREYIFLGTRN